jgi:hypothetical protein
METPQLFPWLAPAYENENEGPLDTVFNNMKIEGQKKLSFGKYKGKTYEEVYMFDHKYCNWCLNINPRTLSVYDFQQYIGKIKYLS